LRIIIFNTGLHTMTTAPAPRINPDGVSVAGCSIIYAPAGQAGEYAPLATNPYRGCGHGCVYCYVPKVLRMDRIEFDAGAVPRAGFLNQLTKDAVKYQTADITEQVMLSFTTDPYHPGDNTLTRQVLETLQDHGMAICTLTKGGSRALRDLPIFRPDRDAFATTLTSLNANFSYNWERKAAPPSDRVAALRAFHDAGIFTWVSLEPTLDCDSSIEIIRQTHMFIDLFKIGRVNYLPMTKTTDWRDYTLRIIDVCQELDVLHYVKKDLQPYLPAGYHNPKRVTQHH
jgi:hypothetical protein